MHEIKFDWFSENREYLISSIEYTKALLVRSLASLAEDEHQDDSNHSRSHQHVYEEKGSSAQVPVWPHDDSDPALDTIAQTFHLSKFEKNILVLCAGAEIDGEISALCSKLYGNSGSKNNSNSSRFPTFDIALRTFPDADWEAILPDSNLRRFQLVTVYNYDDVPLITSPIRIQERILHYLLGFKSVMDSRLDYLVRPAQMTAPVADSARTHLFEIVSAYTNSQQKASGNVNLLAFHLWGYDPDEILLVAQKACEELGLGLWSIPAEILSSSKSPDEQQLSGLLSRECFLTGNALYIDAYDIDDSLKRAIARFAERLLVPLLFVATRQPWVSPSSSSSSSSSSSLSIFSRDSQSTTIEVKRPTRDDQRKMWKECFESTIRDDVTRSQYLLEINRIVDRFNLDSIAIEAIVKKIAALSSPTSSSSSSARATAGKEDEKKGFDPRLLYSMLQSSTYRLTRSRLGDLAEEISPVAKIEDIILPASRKAMIRAIALHFKHRRKVYDEWGFAKKSRRGLGIIALFSGESGTGKTMAAEAIANELGADLYRIDLSMIASKYIGETEKNLRQIFDAAETKESILFFDEADSLFGKRSEVKDSHDRYANLQVGYLLQRIESYDGVVILATNFKKSLDPAFMRRVRFVIDFPFPDDKNREEIWQRVFPENVPLSPKMDFKFLSRLSITGGSIRNIALNAAFLAAEEGNAVSMEHIKRAAEEEYNKLGRGMSAAEIGNWP